MEKKSAPAKLNFIFAVLIFTLTATFLTSTCAYSQNNSQSGNAPFSINNSPLPAPTGFVNDYAGVIDAATKQQIEQKLKNFKDTSNPQVEIAVAVVKTTGERPIFDYSLAVARGWKIGSKADDNPSALLFIAIDDRKYYTQVSKDLEDELPDGLVGSLQRQNLVPAFKQSDYGKGISDTIDSYIQTIQSKQNGTAPPAATTSNVQTGETKKKSSSSSPCNIVTCLIILFVLMIIIFSRGGRGGGGGRGSRWGGGGGFGGGALPWIIGGILSGGSSNGSSSSWGGGGSSSGGGFGGFGGGGDFGGGGAGGDW